MEKAYKVQVTTKAILRLIKELEYRKEELTVLEMKREKAEDPKRAKEFIDESTATFNATLKALVRMIKGIAKAVENDEGFTNLWKVVSESGPCPMESSTEDYALLKAIYQAYTKFPKLKAMTDFPRRFRITEETRRTEEISDEEF